MWPAEEGTTTTTYRIWATRSSKAASASKLQAELELSVVMEQSFPSLRSDSRGWSRNM